MRHARSWTTITLALLVVCGPTAASETTIEGITAYSLDNGLRVLLCPDATSATVTVATTYLVGSRHEGRGEAGMAHMLEHMLTKGTRGFDSIWDTLATAGADFNATTWFDRTNFFETLPAGNDHLDLALHLEAERMTSATLDAAELETEMEVITNEFEYVESDPAQVLSLRAMSAAYHWHPYGRPTIGSLDDIRAYPIGSLRAFYRKHYRPDRATLFVGGRFDPVRARETIDARFGKIPVADDGPTQRTTTEPDQEGPRRVTVRRDGGVPMATVLYRVPPGSHPDAPALEVLQEILTAKPSGKLWEQLVEPGHATDISKGESDALLLAESGVMEIAVSGKTGDDVTALAERAINLVEGVAGDPPDDRSVELARARVAKRLRDDEADLDSFGPALSEWIALGDWRTYFLHRDALHEVGVADVRRVAEKYLVSDNRTVGLWVPTENPTRAEIPVPGNLGERVAEVRGEDAAPTAGAPVTPPLTLSNLDERTLKLRLEPGIEVGLLAKPSRGERVVAAFRFRYGTEADLLGKRAAARLLPGLLLQGTQRLDARDIQDELDLLQSEIEIRGHEGVLGAIVRSDREHLEPTVRLLGEILRRPAFSPEAFATMRDAEVARLEASRSSAVEQAFDALRRATHDWPKSSIHYVPTPEDEIAALDSLEVSEVRALHHELLGAGAAQVAIVGDFDRGTVVRFLADALGTWIPRAAHERVVTPARPVAVDDLVLRIADQRMAVVAMATTLPLRDDAPDFVPLRLASWAFVEKSKAMLSQRLRHEEGLSYHVSGALTADSHDERASLFAYAFCSAENAERAQAILGEELAAWIRDGLDEETLVAAKRSWLAQLSLELADDEQVARRLLAVLYLERSARFDAEAVERTAGLTLEDVQVALHRQLGDAEFFRVRAGDFPAPVRP